MARVSLAGTVADYLEAHPGDIPLEELHAAVRVAGLDVSLEQVYAGVQSMASTSKCGRGHGKRTYCRLADVDPVAAAAKAAGVTPTRRAVAARGIVYPNDTILAYFTEHLGLPVSRPQYDKVYAVLLLGEDSPEYILERAEIVLKHAPTKWCQWKQGSNTMIGFLIETV